jgi:hypothetical protein
MQPQGETDQVNTNKLRIPTLWGKVSLSTGRSMPCDAAVGGTDNAWQQCFEEKYARCGVVYRLPTLLGKNTDPRGRLLPILWGKNTDPPG